ncbi:peptidylprolyl isomerase [Vulgatibacter sp.]|uniref:peptidylprolyl isomerase n=1 Tax=Vulgatibacter sp. TaxID=1971226 RepID=UPI00356726FD
MNRTLLLLAATVLLALTGCKEQQQAEQPAQQQPPAQQQQQAPAAPAAQPAVPADSPLLQPAQLTEQAPAQYRAHFTTTKGDFVIEVQREWAPLAADRFYNLVKNGFFDDTAFFRAVEGFMVQFGIHGDPQVAGKWRTATFPDDAVKQSNQKGMVSFATSGPNSRTTQIFINYKDNAFLDRMGFAPFGKVVEGMDVVDGLYKGYGEGAPRGRGPNQGRIQTEGNAYLRKEFPQLDYVKSAKIVEAK